MLLLIFVLGPATNSSRYLCYILVPPSFEGDINFGRNPCGFPTQTKQLVLSIS